MPLTQDHLPAYESFLESLQLYPNLRLIKGVESDLRGDLNPSALLEKYFFSDKTWVGFEDFFDLYLQKNNSLLKSQLAESVHPGFYEGLRARLYRTQFGFLTEYHAFCIAQSVFGNEKVHRNAVMDTAGVDFRIEFQSEIYNIHIFVDTPRAWKFRNYKSQFKNVEKMEGIHVNLPYSLQSQRFNSLRFLKNHFGVFTLSYLEYLKQEIVAKRIRNNNINGTTATGFLYAN